MGVSHSVSNSVSHSVSPGVLEFWKKNFKNSQKLYKKYTCKKIPQTILPTPILGYLDALEGASGGQNLQRGSVGGFLHRIKKLSTRNLFVYTQRTSLGWSVFKILKLVLYHPPPLPLWEYLKTPRGSIRKPL